MDAGLMKCVRKTMLGHPLMSTLIDNLVLSWFNFLDLEVGNLLDPALVQNGNKGFVRLGAIANVSVIRFEIVQELIQLASCLNRRFNGAKTITR